MKIISDIIIVKKI